MSSREILVKAVNLQNKLFESTESLREPHKASDNAVGKCRLGPVAGLQQAEEAVMLINS